MVSCRQLSILLCAAVLVCILQPGESQIGQACPPAGCDSVIPNSECSQGACECKQGYYDDSGSDCLPIKGLGQSCTNNKECQDSMHCDGGHCAATVSTTSVSAANVSATNVNTTDQNNPSNGARTVISIGDRAVVIQGFLQYVMINRN